ncbi:hypothetical protein ACUOFC_63885, partial [Escherichia sp. TWPC-MK]
MSNLNKFNKKTFIKFLTFLLCNYHCNLKSFSQEYSAGAKVIEEKEITYEKHKNWNHHEKR